MFHKTLDHIIGWVAGVNVHGNDVFSVIDYTKMTLVIIIIDGFMYLARVKNVHCPYVCWCKDNMSGLVVSCKKPLDLLAKYLEILFQNMVIIR